MSDKRIGKFSVRDHGNENSQYFQGCSAVFTEFDHCVTGCGDTLQEAIDDAIEMIAQMGGWDVEGFEDRIARSEYDGEIPDDGSAHESAMEAVGFDDDSEPDEGDYDDPDEYEAAKEAWEKEREEYNDEADCYRYVSILWKEAETERCDSCEKPLTDEDLDEGYTVCADCEEDEDEGQMPQSANPL